MPVNERLLVYWKIRCMLLAKGNELMHEQPASSKRYRDGSDIRDAGYTLWSYAVHKIYPTCRMTWRYWDKIYESNECLLSNGERYLYDITPLTDVELIDMILHDERVAQAVEVLRRS